METFFCLQFLLVACGSEADGHKTELESAHNVAVVGAATVEDDRKSVGSASRSRVNLDQENLFFTHVTALWSKRAANFRRDKKAWLCTTILPSLFVLAGLLIFTYAAQDRSLGPLELKLEDYNAGVKSQPKNPVTVNNINNVFQCQPGICSYDSGNFPIVDTESGSSYTVCGIHSVVNAAVDLEEFLVGGTQVDPKAYQTCTVNQVTKFMESITESGVELVEVNANTVANVSNIYARSSDTVLCIRLFINTHSLFCFCIDITSLV